MATDDRERQMQIREQAGLDESRFNEELIDFLRKWGTPILLIVAAVSVAYAANAHFKRTAADKVETAFGELSSASATANPSPESLRRVADDFAGVKSVGELARLEAADIYLAAVRTGVKPGAQPKPDGTHDAADLMTAEDRSWHLTQARDLYQAVADATLATPGREALALNALYGLAAVAESEGNLDAARQAYTRVIEKSEKSGFPAHASIARARIADLDALGSVPELVSQSQLPPMPEPKIELPAMPAGPELPPAPPAEATPPAGSPTPDPATQPAQPPVQPAPEPAAPPQSQPK